MTRILAVGSEPMARPECRTILEVNDYQIIWRDNLHDAVSLVLDDPPDFLLMESGFAGDKDSDLIGAVKGCLQKTNIPIILVVSPAEMIAGIDWNRFPVDDILVKPVVPEYLLTRVKLSEARMSRVFDNNPLSKLPGNTSILRRIQEVLDNGLGGAVGYIDIDNFKPYNDHYGFSRGDEVILVVARIMVNVINDIARGQGFAGHVGGDDFVFIVPEEMVEDVCRKILANFEVVRNSFIAPEDVKRGGFVEKNRQGEETSFGLLSISIAVIPTSHGKFQHSGEVSAVASQVKHKVKELEGNNFHVDQRHGYSPTS